MPDVKLFYLTHCPYCHNARRALEELIKEQPRYGSVAIEWIEESERPGVAEQYDYYYVPTLFAGREKLYEATPGESYEDCRRQLQAALDKLV